MGLGLCTSKQLVWLWKPLSYNHKSMMRAQSPQQHMVWIEEWYCAILENIIPHLWNVSSHIQLKEEVEDNLGGCWTLVWIPLKLYIVKGQVTKRRKCLTCVPYFISSIKQNKGDMFMLAESQNKRMWIFHSNHCQSVFYRFGSLGFLGRFRSLFLLHWMLSTAHLKFQT